MAVENNDRLVNSPVQPCPLQHWFLERLILHPEANQDSRHPEGRRPDWWPRENRWQRWPNWWPEDEHPGYWEEKVKVTLAGVEPLQTLDESGTFSADGIPAGTATVVHYAFYDDVREALEAGIHF
jgi:hypothetical protein